MDATVGLHPLSVDKNGRMKTILPAAVYILLLTSCHKNETPPAPSCNIENTRTANEAKVSITNGIWGTVSSMEGNCMPMIGPGPSACSHCPVKRTVKIYELATYHQATPQDLHGFYTSINTPLVKELETDSQGFYQIDLAPGRYTVVIVENNKLYTFGFNSDGSLSPVHFEGGLLKTDLSMMYKAAF